MVGLHFLAFGRFIDGFYYLLGAAVLTGGIAGVLTGLLAGGTGLVEAVTGLIVAASLFGSAAWRLLVAGIR